MNARLALFHLALVAASVFTGCSNRYEDYCDYAAECAQDAGLLDGGATGTVNVCTKKSETADDTFSDLCMACLLRIPCNELNACNFDKKCAASKSECQADCP